MPNIKSAIKRVKVTAKKTDVNKQQKSAVRKIVKKAKTAIADGASDARELTDVAMVKIDKAAAKGYMHKNTAARKKSRMAKSLNSVK